MADTRNRVGDQALVGRQFGTARHARQVRRTEAAVIREDFALRMFASGETVADIAAALSRTFNISAHQGSVYRLIRRGLAHKAAQQPEYVANARQMLLDRYDRMFEAHMPLAVGTTTGVPDVRSADLVLKVLDKIAEICGVKVAPPVVEQHTTFNITVPGEADRARADILSALARERDKHEVVEGHLAAAGTGLRELTGGVVENDRLGPPPGVIPTQESEAA
jgi:hypothetical protein